MVSENWVYTISDITLFPLQCSMVKFLPNHDVSKTVMSVTKEIGWQSCAKDFPFSQLSGALQTLSSE